MKRVLRFVFFNLQNCVKMPLMIPNYPQTFYFSSPTAVDETHMIHHHTSNQIKKPRMFQVEVKTSSPRLEGDKPQAGVEGRRQLLAVRGAGVIGDITKG